MFPILSNLIKHFTEFSFLSADEKYVLSFAADIVAEKMKSQSPVLYGNWCAYGDCFLITRVTAQGIQQALLNDVQLQKSGVSFEVAIAEYGAPEYNSPDGYGKYLGSSYEPMSPNEKEYSLSDLQKIAKFADLYKLWI